MTNIDQKDKFEHLVFDNSFTRELPGDPETANYRRQVTNAHYSRVRPAKVSAPTLLSFSEETAELLDLSVNTCTSSRFNDVFSGNALLQGMDPYAMCYGGHQFGKWAGQLGDGRAINLGEIINKRNERWVLQLKGAGTTPYSRNADGLAVLRSSLREYVCSESMFHLGVPTTRALSLIVTGDPVERDMFYDGHPQEEPGAIVCRVAPSFIRFGNFEIHSARGELEALKRLVDYTIKTSFPHLGEPATDTYIRLFEEVCTSTLDMVIHWMRVGFVHGVMNTDNMSILGQTIDYGPYGWLEGYDPDWTPNTTDRMGRRYCFGNQPKIAQWNLSQLANALYPLVNDAAPFEKALQRYSINFKKQYLAMTGAKLGIREVAEHTDQPLFDELYTLLQLTETDMTIFFRDLAAFDRQKMATGKAFEPTALPFYNAYYNPTQINDDYWQRLQKWLQMYAKRLQNEGMPSSERHERMNRVNPKYVLRNYLAQLAIDAAEQGDGSLVTELLDVMRQPYKDQPDKEQYAQKRPEWARNRPGCSMLSCSS